jgi:hypothetical protein
LFFFFIRQLHLKGSATTSSAYAEISFIANAMKNKETAFESTFKSFHDAIESEHRDNYKFLKIKGALSETDFVNRPAVQKFLSVPSVVNSTGKCFVMMALNDIELKNICNDKKYHYLLCANEVVLQYDDGREFVTHDILFVKNKLISVRHTCELIDDLKGLMAKRYESFGTFHLKTVIDCGNYFQKKVRRNTPTFIEANGQVDLFHAIANLFKDTMKELLIFKFKLPGN